MNATLQTQANFGKHDVFKMFVLFKPACLHVFSGTGDAVCSSHLLHPYVMSSLYSSNNLGHIHCFQDIYKHIYLCMFDCVHEI